MKKVIFSSVLLIAAAVVVFYAASARSFVPEVTSNATARNKWTTGINFVVNPAHGANVTGTDTSASAVTAVIVNSFNTWRNAPNTALPLGTNLGGTSTSTAIGNDGTNLICFTCNPPGGFGQGDTIAITLTTTNSATGQIIDADMVFNPSVTFLTDFTTPASNQQSLQTVATHEFGHFLGLDHTGVIRAIMNPFAPAFMTTLSYDDVAGISTNYPGTSPSGASYTSTSITGTVRNSAGAGVFGAHVFAESVTTAAPISGARKSPISAITRPDGTYSISGLPPDTYIITAEPFDGPVTNDNLGWGDAFNQPVATNFTSRTH